MRSGLVVFALVLGACDGGRAATGDAGPGDDDPGVTDALDGSGARDGESATDGTAIDAGPDGPTSSDAGTDPTLLSMQGVYGDFAARSIPSDAFTYEVRWELWVDGATKRRWLLLPPGGQIDNTDQEHWRFPVGTRQVKEFTRGGTLVETRIIETLASGTSLRTFVWNAAQTDAVLMVDGAIDVAGTPHDAPTAHDCMKCHQSEPGGSLGISAVQLPPAILAALSAAGKLRIPIAAGTMFGPTGTPAQVDALGYLHGNCGHCHNPGGYAAGTNNMSLRLDALAKAATSEPGWLTTVGVTVQGNGAGAGKRIDPMNPQNSAVVRRMSVRGNYDQMPLVGSEVVHSAGVSTVTSWVNTIAP